MKKLLLVCVSLSFAVATMLANVNVQGVVTDADSGEPLIGVSILVQGTTTGTVTDYDGAYTLDVPDNAVLQFSYMGYKSVEKKAQSVLNLQMESDAIMMDEVVSLGYSAVKKAELSSAVVTISADKLTDVTTSDVGTMLQGKIAGVQVANTTGAPGSSAEIKIRGTGSITASSAPVYVVDGVMGGSFNPNDVETISVLKDAGSTGVYGAAAAGGVIVVTTKSGKKGTKPMVNLNMSAGANQALFGRYKKMNSEEMYYYQKSFWPKALFKEQRPASLLNEDYSWRDEYFKTGITQDYSVSVSGGSEKVGYYVSFNYYKQEGTLKGTDYERFSGRANVNAQVTKWLDMAVRFNFDKDKRNNIYSWRVLDDAYNKMPWDNPYDVNTGEPLYMNGTSMRPDNGKPWYSQYKWNTLHGMTKNYNRDDGFNMGSDIQLAIHFTDWLTLQSTVRYSYGTYKNTDFLDPDTQDGAPLGSISNSLGISNSIGTTTILKGGYQWGKHSFNAMLGHEWGKWKSEYTTAAGQGAPTGVESLNACGTPLVASGYEVPGASWAAFAQASYDYAKRYFITATFRAEASSIFAPNKRVGYFPSVAASWLISNESWMEPYRKTLSMLKLRASYGITGNNHIPEYQYLSTVALSNSYQGVTAGQFTRLSNPELHWETANMATIGIDLGFLNRIDMNIDLYNTDNTGLLLAVPVAPSTGFFEVIQNTGTVRNQGIEFAIDATAIQTKDWRWDIGFNIGFNKNRVIDIPNHTPFLQSENDIYQQVKEGQDLYSWYLKEWAGVDPKNGDPLWYMIDENENYVLDENGNKMTTNDYNAAGNHVVGTATPIFQGGLNTAVSWKGLSLSVVTNFNYGNLVYNANRESADSDGAYSSHNALSMDNGLGWVRWEKTDPDTWETATHPAAVYNGNKNSNKPSSRYLEDGSFFRLKNITLSYDFATIIPKGYVSKLRLYVSADNIATATKYSGMDPEVSISTSGGSLAGYSADQYPICRNIMCGLEVQF